MAKSATVRVSDAELRAAERRGKEKRSAGGFAKSVRYDATSRRIFLELTNGVLVAVPIGALPEIAGAEDADLACVALLGAGDGVAWEALDADYSVAGLILASVGTVAARQVLARSGGLAKSRAKAKAARANGKKGGRPRKRAAVPA